METTAPPSAPPQRLHPLSLVQRFVRSLPGFLVLLLPMFFRAPGQSDWFNLTLVIIFAVLTLPLILLHYLRFSYQITPKEIIIESGILTRRKRNIPIEKIQNIEIEQSLLPRALGIAKVKIETAGSQSAEGELEYVGLDEAQRIRATVRAFQRTPRTADTQGGTAEPAALPPPEETVLFEMPFRRLLLSGMFRFSLLYLAVIFSILQQFDLNRVIEAAFDWMSRGRFEPYIDQAMESPVLAVTLALLLTLLLGWATGIAITIARYYGFRLSLEDNKLHKRSGLFTVAEGTIPLRKVQALILRSNPLMRRFGWYRLELQTMGADVREQGHQVAVPFAQREDILEIAPHIRSFTLPSTFTPVSRLHIRRSFVRYALLLVLVVAPLAYFWRIALWGFLLFPVLLGLAYLQWRLHGYALDDDMLYIRRGVLGQHLWIIPLEKLQVFYASRSLFQRRLGLTSLLIDTAGAGTFNTPAIYDVPSADASAFLDRLYAAFQGCFSPGSPAAAPPLSPSAA